MGKAERKIRQTFRRVARDEVSLIKEKVFDNKPKWLPNFIWMPLVRRIVGDSFLKQGQKHGR